MDNQRTRLHGPQCQPQSKDKAIQQRIYRGREKDAFHKLRAAMKEVEPANPRSRRETLKRAVDCLRRLGEERLILQQQLTESMTWTNAPQPEVHESPSDEDFWLYLFPYPGEQMMGVGEPSYGGWHEAEGIPYSQF